LRVAMLRKELKVERERDDVLFIGVRRLICALEQVHEEDKRQEGRTKCGRRGARRTTKRASAAADASRRAFPAIELWGTWCHVQPTDRPLWLARSANRYPMLLWPLCLSRRKYIFIRQLMTRSQLWVTLPCRTQPSSFFVARSLWPCLVRLKCFACQDNGSRSDQSKSCRFNNASDKPADRQSPCLLFAAKCRM
jgi:hypothetical protein